MDWSRTFKLILIGSVLSAPIFAEGDASANEGTRWGSKFSKTHQEGSGRALDPSTSSTPEESEIAPSEIPMEQRQTVVLSFAGGYGSDESGMGEKLFSKMKPSFANFCKKPTIHCIIYVTDFITDPDMAKKALNGQKPKQRLKVTKFDWGWPIHPTKKPNKKWRWRITSSNGKQNFVKNPSAVAAVYGHSWGGGLSFNQIDSLAKLCATDPKHCHHLLRSTLIDPVSPEVVNPASLMEEIRVKAPSLNHLVKIAKGSETVSVVKKLELLDSAKSELRLLLIKVFGGINGPHNAGLSKKRMDLISAMLKQSNLSSDPEETIHVEYQENYPFLRSRPISGLDNHRVKTGNLVTLNQMLALVDKLTPKKAPEAIEELKDIYENNAHGEIALDAQVIKTSSENLVSGLRVLAAQRAP